MSTQMQVRIVPMTAEHLDEAAALLSEVFLTR